MMRRLRRDEYTVGWVCALPVELAAAQEMLDEEYETPLAEADDPNIYTCGRVGEHNVVIACLPEGQTGTNSAAAVAVQMKSTFPSTRFGLMVGIGGGVPSEEADIRLGDVVVSKPHKVHGGVVQYDFGKTTLGGRFERTGLLNTPPTVLLNAVANLRARHMRGKSRLTKYLSRFDSLPDFTREAAGVDTLFDATYDHTGGATCAQCDKSYIVARKPRKDEIMVHYGTIASGNQVMRSATERDKISADLGGVLCFEMEAAGLMNSFPCLVIRGICDYADSHKHKRWQAYAAGTAAAYAKEVLSVMPPAEVAQTRKAEFEIASHEFLPLLYENTCIYEESKTRNRQRVPGTCEWFKNHNLFKEWNSQSNSQVPGLLYVTADPGCGKSVLSRYLIDEILPRAGRTVCFFFFKDDFEQQKSSTSAVCSLLHQLFDCNPHLLTDDVLTGYVTRGKGFFESFDNLWHTFLLAANNREIFCVLDALDECRDEDRKQLIGAVSAICNISSSKGTQQSRPRFLVTSRPYEHIRAHFSIQLKTSVASIHLQGDQGTTADAIAEEIQLVLDSRINETANFFRLEPDERVMLRKKLESVPNRTYLWITLVFDGLMKRKSGVSKHDIMNLIRQPPQSVYDVYEQILDKSPDRQDARRLLHIIVGATRPLSLAEMSIALAFENKQSVASVSERIIPHSRIGTYVRGLCGLFATIVDGKVYLLHQTAREFLLNFDSDDLPRELRHNFDNIYWSDKTESCVWRHSISMANAHAVLAEICILYLLSEFATHDSPLLDYAAINWFVHYRQSPDICQTDMARMAKDLCSHPEKSFQWTQKYIQDTGYHIPNSCLSLASVIGLEKIVEMMLWEKYAISINRDGKLSSRISLIRRLSRAKQSLLVKHVWHDDTDVQFALSYAAGSGHQDVVKLLLRIKDDINIRSKDFWYGGMPLSLAALNGHEGVVEMLLESKVSIESKDNNSRTPLWNAAQHGRTAVVKLLLERKARTETKDRDWTPLFIASRNGHTAVVKLLLRSNAKIEAKDYDSRTPLFIASENGHAAIVKLLLESKANPEAKDDVGQTPLLVATKNKHTAVAKILLENNAATETKDIRGRQPLSCAAENGNVAIVKLLLDSNAAFEIRDSPGRTPLWCAAQNGHAAVVKLLLERNARFEIMDARGRTPLWCAAQNGHAAVVKVLLQSNANINSRDSSGWTPLLCAALDGHVAVVKVLLQNNASINSRDDRGRTPLCWAALRGHEAVVKALLQTGQADVDLEDDQGQTPLSYAIQNNHEAVIKLLRPVSSP